MSSIQALKRIPKGPELNEKLGAINWTLKYQGRDTFQIFNHLNKPTHIIIRKDYITMGNNNKVLGGPYMGAITFCLKDWQIVLEKNLACVSLISNGSFISFYNFDLKPNQTKKGIYNGKVQSNGIEKKGASTIG